MKIFQYYIMLVVLLAAAVVMLYFCVDINSKPDNLESTKYLVTLSNFYSARKYNANNVFGSNKAFSHHAKTMKSIITNHKNKETVRVGNDTATTNGTILVTLYAEQQVGAAMNMFSLQKWAKAVGASVVEPFVDNSMFKLPIVSSERQLADKLRFRDYFNFDIWNNMSIAMNGTPLIPWEEFIDQAPKKYIFVAIVNSFKKVERPMYIDDEIIEQEDCNGTFNHLNTKYKFYIDYLLQIKLVQRVCLSFYKTIMHIDDFTDIIYGNFKSSDVVVWIQIWKGFARHDRVRVMQQYFHRSKETFAMLHTSKRILDDSDRYIKTILKSEPGKFIAISIRTVLRGKFLPKSNHSSFFHNCINKLGSIIDHSTSISNCTKFVAIDLGRFGDRTAENFIDKNIIDEIESDVFHTIYNNSLSMQKWEHADICTGH